MDFIKKDALFNEVESILNKLGFKIIALTTGKKNGQTHLNLVVHHPEGVKIEDCSRISKSLLPRVEILLDSQDVTMEVSSPGIGRKIKMADEFLAFKGKTATILSTDYPSWIIGEIGELVNDEIHLKVDEKDVVIKISDIQKAKLHYSWGS